VTPAKRGAKALHPRKQVDTVFQSDLAMNLFMVLMVFLATLAVSTVAITQVGFKVRMTPDPISEPQPPLGMVRSWAPVLPILPRLVVRDGSVQRLDLDRLAESFAAGRAVVRGIDQSQHLEKDPDPSAYLVDFVLLNDAIPDEILSWRIPGTALAQGSSNDSALEPLNNDLLAFHQFDVFIYPGQEELAWGLLARLHKANKRYRVVFVHRSQRLEIERESSRFTFEDRYK
jgi:hypothetical protein